MNSEKLNIFRRQINKKFEKLSKLESLLENEFKSKGNDVKISRKIYACLDGFIILRTFSEFRSEPFQFSAEPERLDVFLRQRLPIRTNEGYVSLYNLLKDAVGLELSRGQTIDLGSQGPGITVCGRFQIDGFQIIIRDYKNLEEIQETLSDISFAHYGLTEIHDLENENNILKNIIVGFKENKNPLIITEGKTDWKYFISALRYFHTKNEFENIQENWFLKFGLETDINLNNCGTNFLLDNSVSKLNKILDSLIESRNLDTSNYFPSRIGIFDSDEALAKNRNDSKNRIYSFLIEPKGISTELLFSEQEIKTKVADKRLYLGHEFDEKSGRLKADLSIVIGNENNIRNKIGGNKIIDSNVFDSSNNNIALSKEEFAKSIYSTEIKISAESWEKFRHIFVKISEYL